MSVTLILADTEIEVLTQCGPGGKVPPRVCNAAEGELRGIVILDSHLHRAILEGLDDAERRGRPDIAHSFLLIAQGSRLNQEGRLRVFVHTRGDEVVRLGRKAKVDPNYLSFLRGLSGLLATGQPMGKGEEQFSVNGNQTLKSLLNELKPDVIIALSNTGKKLDLKGVLEELPEKEVVVIIGGFPEGDYNSPVYELADLCISLGDELLTVPDVTVKVLDSIP